MSLCRELCIGAALQCQHWDGSSYSSYLKPPRPTDPQASAVPADLRRYLRGMMGFEIIKHLEIAGLVGLLKILTLLTQHGVRLTGKRPVFSKHRKSFSLYIGSMVQTLTNWSPKTPAMLIREAASLSFASSRSLGGRSKRWPQQRSPGTPPALEPTLRHPQEYLGFIGVFLHWYLGVPAGL